MAFLYMPNGVRPDAWTAVCTFLRDDPTLAMEMLTDLTCVDRFGDEPRFDVVVHLYSVSKKHRVRLYGGVPEESPAEAAPPVHRVHGHRHERPVPVLQVRQHEPAEGGNRSALLTGPG